jgi:hypothetical protein
MTESLARRLARDLMGAAVLGCGQRFAGVTRFVYETEGGRARGLRSRVVDPRPESYALQKLAGIGAPPLNELNAPSEPYSSEAV